jgi:hypothetical protein
MKLTIVPRTRMIKLCLHSLIHLHGIVLHYQHRGYVAFLISLVSLF